MNSFVNYLFESGISLSLFALIYFLFLRKETFFNVNRWFLLVSIGFSALLPVLRIQVLAPQSTMLPEITVTPYVNLLSTFTIYSSSLSHETEQFVLTNTLIVYIYLLGVAFFATKLFIQIYQIIRLIKQNKVVPEGRIKLVILDRELSPFSFLNYIFVSHNLQNTKGWENMLEHEKQHIQQGHTFDVLILEFVAVFQWFNPFFWIFRRALRENHEFLADQAVISHGTALSKYKQILINQYVGDQIVLANNFNYSLIKTRIQMMSKIKSSKITYAKIALGVVLAGSLTAAFAFEPKEVMNFQSSPKEELKEEILLSRNVIETELKETTLLQQNTEIKTEVKSVQTPNKKTTILVIEGKQLEISGDKAVVDKLKNILSDSGDYEIKTDAASGQLTLVSKTNKVNEVVAVGYGKSGKPELTEEKEEVYGQVEQMPEYPGGDLGLRKFLAYTVKYPVEAQEKGIQGKVFVSFVVRKDGSMSNVKIARGVDPTLDKEALRVVNNMPKWIPGKQGGKDVAVSFTVPINFVLQ